MSWELRKFASDLSNLIKLIVTYDIPIETDKLYSLEEKIKSTRSYYIEAKDIVIHVFKKISGTKPAGITKLSIFFSHICELDTDKDYKINDLIKNNYYFYYQINGYDSEADNKEYVNCWRLDQHILSETSKYTHPYYHFQAGGDELLSKETGDLILLAAPRLPHPPMDLFLGLHFILNNYLSTKDYPNLLAMFNDYEYQEIIKRAQERMWYPYFNSFTIENQNTDYTFEKVFPLYLK